MIRAYVLADPLIAAQIGTRLWPLKLPQNPTTPAMVLQEISGSPQGKLKGPASLDRPRYQFDVYTKEGTGSAFETVTTIGSLLRDRLEGRTVKLLDTDESPAEYRIFAFELLRQWQQFETDVNGGFYRYSADYFVMHQTGKG